MKKIILFAFLGIVLLIAGVYMSYVYVIGIDTGANILLLILALVFLASGVYLLISSGKSDITVLNKGNGKKLDLNVNSFEASLEKNNQLTSKWAKTVEKRDRMKMLEITTAAQANAEE